MEMRDIVIRNCLCAVLGDVLRESKQFLDGIASAIEAPFVAVGVKDVGLGLESLPLLPIAALELRTVGADLGRFQFDVPIERAINKNSKISHPKPVIRA